MTDVLRYRGDITQTIDRDHLIGPDFGQRYLLPRKVTYDRATDRTTVKLRGVMPQEFRDRVSILRDGQVERERIRQVFNG